MKVRSVEITGKIGKHKWSYIVGDREHSIAPVSADQQTTINRSSLRRSSVNYLVFTACASIYLLPFMRLLLAGTDEGTLVEGAVRVLHGQVFARDFFEVMGPGTFYWLAAFLKLFGATFFAERVCLFVTSLGTFLLMYYLSRRVCRRYQISPPIFLAGVYFSNIWPMVNHHVDSNFFALLSIACIVLWKDTRKNLLLLAAGAGAGITTCILQPKGILLLLAFFLWLWIQRRRQASQSLLWLVAAGYFGLVGLMLLYFWSRGALRDLLYINLVWPYQNYGAVNAIPYARGLLQYWTHWAAPIHGVRWLIPLAVVLFAPFLLIAVLPALVLLLAIPHGKHNLRPEILLYWLCGWALWLSEVHRRDISHLISGSPLLIILCIHFLAEYRGKIADLSLQLLSVCAVALATVNLFLVLSAHPFQTRVGTVVVFKPDPVLTFLDTHVPAGTEIFTYPYCPVYYFFSATTNPTRYSLLMYNYNTASQFHDAIRTLDQRKVRYVVWDTKFEAEAAHLFTAVSFQPAGGFIMEPYLASHYRVVRDLGGMQILERKPDGSAAQH